MESSDAPIVTRWMRVWSLVEIVLIVGLIETYLWFLKGTPNQQLSHLVVVLIVSLVGFSTWRLRYCWPSKGGLRVAWLKVCAGSLLMAGTMLLAGWGLGILNTEAYSDFWSKIIGDQTWLKRKTGTIVAQQVALQFCLLPACIQLTNRRWGGIALAATLFSLIHSPNPYLMLLTLVAGVFWCWMWLDSRRIVPLICSHMLLAVLAREYCNDALYNMRVGRPALDLFPMEIVTASGESFINDPMQLKGEWNVLKIDGDRVTCRGWVADVRRRQLVDELVVLSDCDGKTRRFTMEGLPSDFVREAYGSKIENSAFEITLPLELFLKSVRIYGCREGVGYAEIPYGDDIMLKSDRNPYRAAQFNRKRKLQRLADQKRSSQQRL